MDYKTYLDFVLALENRHEPQSLHYLFRILDINNRGFLDTFCLNYFFRVCIIFLLYTINFLTVFKSRGIAFAGYTRTDDNARARAR